MRVRIVTLVSVCGLCAANGQQLALALKAQSDFDKVTLSPLPQMAGAASCVQSQAAALSVALPEELSLLYFRKGFCELAGATITRNNSDFLAAAAGFDHAIGAWGGRMRKASKKDAEPVPTGLRVLPSIARLHATAGGEVRSTALHDISAALESPYCASNLMPAMQCEGLIQTAREWLGAAALGEGRLDEAARDFAGADGSGWTEWVEGRRQFEARNYSGAAAQYGKAIDTWKALWREPGPSLSRRLGPTPELPRALADLGGVQLLSGNTHAAIASLDAAIKGDSSNAQAFYRRARAREVAGQFDAAMGDYSMASRLAFAESNGVASGEAHLYRGIFLYRRKDFARAEDEFSSALNFQIGPPLKADAEAWRHLAAVAGGSCVSAREELDRSLPSVSPYFPKDEARQASSACTGSLAATGGLH